MQFRKSNQRLSCSPYLLAEAAACQQWIMQKLEAQTDIISVGDVIPSYLIPNKHDINFNPIFGMTHTDNTCSGSTCEHELTK